MHQHSTPRGSVGEVQKKEAEKKDVEKKDVEKKDAEKEEAEKQPTSRTPSPRRTIEALNSPEVKAAVEAQRRHAIRQIPADQVLPLGSSGAQASTTFQPQVHSGLGGRLSAVTTYSGAPPTPTSPAGDSGVGVLSEATGQASSWGQAQVVRSIAPAPATPMPSGSEVCLCCQGSVLVSCKCREFEIVPTDWSWAFASESSDAYDTTT